MNLLKQLDCPIEPNKTLAKIEHEGFTILCSVALDEDADLSWLGEFSDRPADKFAVANSETRERHEFKFFNAENVEDNAQALQNYRRALSYGDSWVMYGSIVTVKKNGIELGQASIWGTESDSSEEHFLDLFNDLIPEALDEAKMNLKGLLS